MISIELHALHWKVRPTFIFYSKLKIEPFKTKVTLNSFCYK